MYTNLDYSVYVLFLENLGFTVSRFPGLNMFALQCNGSHLPSDVRSVQHISLERHSLNNDRPPYIIASLSSVGQSHSPHSHSLTVTHSVGQSHLTVIAYYTQPCSVQLTSQS
ncbi:hypothetical protein Btru_073641 [Bulinus truncatus]|nr:hypothetical protein Btru_073641 [Bulinus truncatus]